jgi:hypothetical protein
MSIFLQDSSFLQLEKLIQKTTTEKTLNSGFPKAYTTGLDSKFNQILKSILSVESIIGEYNVHVAMLLEEFIPWGIHTDYSKGDNNPGYAVLIPLETVDSNTVIFNEECLDNFNLFKKTNKHKENNALLLKSSILSHIDSEDLKYVTVKSIENWEKGKLIVWDRKLLHTSDNFLQNNIKIKRAFVVFTSKIN